MNRRGFHAAATNSKTEASLHHDVVHVQGTDDSCTNTTEDATVLTTKENMMKLKSTITWIFCRQILVSVHETIFIKAEMASRFTEAVI